MSPAPLQPAKTELMRSKGQLAPLKINKDSHSIKKLSQQRQPVIIYTHSPKIIHTHPSNFMELVQKLTGLSSSDNASAKDNENETTSSLITKEMDNCNYVEDMVPPDYVNNFPVFGSDLVYLNKPILNFADPSWLF